MIGPMEQRPGTRPFSVELRRTSGFLLRREADEDDLDGAGEIEQRQELLVDVHEVASFRAALLQVWAHQHFAEGGWDTSRSWLSSSQPFGYTEEQIAAANEPWSARLSGAAVVISGPFWNLTVRPSGAFSVDIE
jgi:hypothetical protein